MRGSTKTVRGFALSTPANQEFAFKDNLSLALGLAARDTSLFLFSILHKIVRALRRVS